MKPALRRFLHNHGNIATEGSPKPGLHILLFWMTSRVLYSVQYHRQHYTLQPLNSLEHCICTTTITIIRRAQHSNLVPPGYKPQNQGRAQGGGGGQRGPDHALELQIFKKFPGIEPPPPLSCSFIKLYRDWPPPPRCPWRNAAHAPASRYK